MDQPLCSTASQRQHGCGIMGKHALQGGESNGPDEERIWGSTWYSWCGISLVLHVITRCPHFASHMPISDSGPAHMTVDTYGKKFFPTPPRSLNLLHGSLKRVPRP